MIGALADQIKTLGVGEAFISLAGQPPNPVNGGALTSFEWKDFTERGISCHQTDWAPGSICPEQPQRQLEKLRQDFGQVFLAALADPDTVEIMLNADGTLWQERLGEPMRQIGTMSPTSAEEYSRSRNSLNVRNRFMCDTFSFQYKGRKVRVVENGGNKPEFRFDTIDELGVLSLGHATQEAAIEQAKRIIDIREPK
jgi:hypothetical protein